MLKIQANKNLDILGYIVSILLAMCLNIISFPLWLNHLNPDWVLLVLIYWAMATPEKIGVINAWVIGVLVDVLTGCLLGQHALAYALIIYTCLNLHRRIRHYLIPQQSLFVFFCLLLFYILMFLIENLEGYVESNINFWLPIFTGPLVWPIICLLLRRNPVFRFYKH
jgi:rod shape-determining protein MreD